MPGRVEWLIWKVVGSHDGAANKSLQRKCCKHIQADATEIPSVSYDDSKKGEFNTNSYNRAMFTMTLLDGKLFNMFPWVFEPNERKPAIPMARHITSDIPVE